ncbi:MAG: hypothetical protein IIA82_08275 [Thaumarchaeota archaeon]|nr:hypothetical protein [Nitrososphaerota archaeon]
MTQRLKAKQVDDKKQVLDMISKLVDDPEKFKEILRKYKETRVKNFHERTVRIKCNRIC